MLKNSATPLLLILALAACGPKMATTAPTPCTGAEAVLVRNETGGPIDVYMSEGSTSSSFVGSVGPGATTLGLPPNAGKYRSFYGKNAAGNTVAGRSSTQSRLSFSLICQ